GKTFEVCLIDDEAALIWAANLGTVEFHPFLGRADALDNPSQLVFDLDPGPPATIVDCCDIALILHEALDAAQLTSFPKTSGFMGLHIQVPVGAHESYESTKAFVRTFAQQLERRLPDRVVSRMATPLRPGKVFVDWSQNDRGK